MLPLFTFCSYQMSFPWEINLGGYIFDCTDDILNNVWPFLITFTATNKTHSSYIAYRRFYKVYNSDKMIRIAVFHAVFSTVWNLWHPLGGTLYKVDLIETICAHRVGGEKVLLLSAAAWGSLTAFTPILAHLNSQPIFSMSLSRFLTGLLQGETFGKCLIHSSLPFLSLYFFEICLIYETQSIINL